MAFLIIGIGSVGALAAVALYSAFVEAWVLTILWGWFVVPTYGITVPPLPILAGIILIISAVAHQSYPSYKKLEHNTAVEMVQMLIAPWLTLAAGWLIHLFV